MFATQAYQAALNALLAEHALGLTELVPENTFAAELKKGLLSALKAGDRTRFDETYWTDSFNRAERLVQLNLVAMGFSELGHRPMLPGEDWLPVRNPWVIRGIEKKIEKASQHIEHRHQLVVKIRGGKLSLRDWGLLDSNGDVASDTSGAEDTSVQFMAEMPHPEKDKVESKLNIGKFLVLYYEHPRTIGAIEAGIEQIFKYPQVAVIYFENRPMYMVRVEKSEFGGSMLGVLHAAGTHTNLGHFKPTNIYNFLSRVSEFVNSIEK